MSEGTSREESSGTCRMPFPRSAISAPQTTRDPVVACGFEAGEAEGPLSTSNEPRVSDSPAALERVSSPSSAPLQVFCKPLLAPEMAAALKTLQAANAALETELGEKSRALDELDMWVAEFDEVKQAFEKGRSQFDVCKADLVAKDIAIELLASKNSKLEDQISCITSAC